MPKLRPLAPVFALATCAAWLAPLPVAQAAEPALERLVGADAALVLTLADVPALRARFAASPSGRAWSDPDIARFVAPLFAHPNYKRMVETVKQETGHSPEELLALASGDLLLAVPAGSLKMGGGKFDGALLLALEVGDNEAKIRELLERHQAKAKESGAYTDSTEDYNGVTLHRVRPAAASATEEEAARALHWALHEGRWFIGSTRETVTAALDALAAGGLAESLSTSPRHRAVLDRGEGRPDYAAYVDFQAVYPLLVASLEAARDPAQPPNMLGIEPLNVIKALGLDALGMVSTTGTFAADGSGSSDIVLSYQEARGVVNLLSYRDGPVARPDWVPASWINVSSQNYSVADFYAELERILDRISPMVAGMAMGQIKGFDRQLGINLKRDLIENLGPAFISGVVPPAGSSPSQPPPYDEMEQFFAIGLADAAAFERTLEALKGRFFPPAGGPLETREYLERKLHVFTPPMPGAKPFAYSITDGWLLFSMGSPGPLEAVLQAMHNPEGTSSFWAREDVRAALDRTPGSAFSVQFVDLRALFASVSALLAKNQAERGGEAPVLVDGGAVPSVEAFARYYSYVVTHGERGSRTLSLKSVTPAQPAP